VSLLNVWVLKLFWVLIRFVQFDVPDIVQLIVLLLPPSFSFAV
jgi:hypothetical protein